MLSQSGGNAQALTPSAPPSALSDIETLPGHSQYRGSDAVERALNCEKPANTTDANLRALNQNSSALLMSILLGSGRIAAPPRCCEPSPSVEASYNKPSVAPGT